MRQVSFTEKISWPPLLILLMRQQSILLYCFDMLTSCMVNFLLNYYFFLHITRLIITQDPAEKLPEKKPRDLSSKVFLFSWQWVEHQMNIIQMSLLQNDVMCHSERREESWIFLILLDFSLWSKWQIVPFAYFARGSDKKHFKISTVSLAAHCRKIIITAEQLRTEGGITNVD